MPEASVVKRLAPAKVNLTLEVMGKRPDGYHEIRSIMQTVSIFDSLEFTHADTVEVLSGNPGWQAEASLVPRAAAALQGETGCLKGARIVVNKLIPLFSGLGGDSSDAAATLTGLASLWGLDIHVAELTNVAAGLGSDVPFFIRGGTALAEGRGEVVTPLPPFPRRYLVIVVPDVPGHSGKTRRQFESLKEADFTSGEITKKMAVAISSGREPPALYNVFEAVVFGPDSPLNPYVGMLAKSGADNLHLAGSGPAMFSVFEDREAAAALHVRWLKSGLDTFLAETHHPEPEHYVSG